MSLSFSNQFMTNLRASHLENDLSRPFVQLIATAIELFSSPRRLQTSSAHHDETLQVPSTTTNPSREVRCAPFTLASAGRIVLVPANATIVVALIGGRSRNQQKKPYESISDRWDVIIYFMERAGFIFQIFFESLNLSDHGNTEFSISFRLFQLPVIDVARKSGPPGRFDLSVGKRLTLKMPYVEVLDECPLFLLFRLPRAGRSNDRTPAHRVNLQTIFDLAIRTPGRYIQQHFNERLTGPNGELLATVQFTLSICYTSSTQEEAMSLPPITVPAESSMEEDASQRSTSRAKKDVAVNTREFPPEIPETRRRSIFFFDRADLMEENRVLAAEIRELTAMVQRLRDVVDTRRTETQNARLKGDRRHRTDYIYHPRVWRPTEEGGGLARHSESTASTGRRKTVISRGKVDRAGEINGRGIDAFGQRMSHIWQLSTFSTTLQIKRVCDLSWIRNSSQSRSEIQAQAQWIMRRGFTALSWICVGMDRCLRGG
jgi:hypothetical protein